MDSNNLIFIFFLIIFNIFFYKYFLIILKKISPELLVDNQFKKPQAFHEFSISTSGGTLIFFSFLILCLFFLFTKQVIYYEYLSFCIPFFLLGLLDDLRLNIRPKFRLILIVYC